MSADGAVFPAMFLAIIYGFVIGIWFGLLPYMLLRYRRCDLFGHGTYKVVNGRQG